MMPPTSAGSCKFDLERRDALMMVVMALIASSSGPNANLRRYAREMTNAAIADANPARRGELVKL